jgi:hypothetical protein
LHAARYSHASPCLQELYEQQPNGSEVKHVAENAKCTHNEWPQMPRPNQAETK